jgi:hypothetical protein
MKTLNSTILAFAVIFSASCTLRSERKSTFRTDSQITQSFTTGPWYISSFIKNGEEQKEKYAAYNFKFTHSNRIIADDNMNRYMGDWSVSGIDGSEDKLPVDKNFIISIKSPPIFSDLNEGWAIVDRSSSELTLSRARQKEGNQYLTFEKR